ncbi:hypothetical protein Rs2_15740 [Raphanus sativus]|nr:hypothetical protein Rs2_15740 [Raphanus sativus]
MAIQYISDSDKTERQARILRVQHSIELEKANPPALLTKLSHELNKEKGHVFDYSKNSPAPDDVVNPKPYATLSAPVFGRLSAPNEALSSGDSSNAPSRPNNPTVFNVGASSSTFTRISKAKKKERRRPPAWVRHIRPVNRINTSLTSFNKNGKEEVVSTKRKQMKVKRYSATRTQKPNPIWWLLI